VSEVRVWAPQATSVDLVTGDRRAPMTPEDGGWWRGQADGDYGLSLDGGPPRPDPRSVHLPHGVHGPTRPYDHGAFSWTDATWRGTPLRGSVLYELHVGTFTAEGTFDAAVERLDGLVDLGVTAVELLPCNGFDGRWGWGYDGVALLAVHEPYGGPDGLKRFVDACHARGLGVVMDVVLNHLGPSGNYLSEFGPYLTDAHSTPWGSALNLDQEGSDEVRRFLVDVCLSWLRDFHCDGLRLDAVHALRDDRAVHLLEQIAVEVGELAAEVGRPLFLVAESDLNDPRFVTPLEAGGLGMDGQWADDVHHAVHALVTGERDGYYGDFGSLPTLAKALTGVFVHDGCWSSFRGRSHGRPVPPALDGWRFVTYTQDHDQVGNRAVGDRPQVIDGLLKVSAALVLLSPFTPMLFMGEEHGARTPWMFFSDHSGDLGEAVRQGRRAEFARHGWATEDVPDPQDERTFLGSKLDWSEQGTERGKAFLAWYRELLALRRTWPELADGRRDRVEVTYDEDARWVVVRRGRVALACNLSGARQEVPLPGTPVTVLLSSATGFAFADGRVEVDGESATVLQLL
jgi:maltooligosyltrehalose trehalohydrolase